MIYYDGLKNSMDLMEVDVDPNCPNHAASRPPGTD